MPETQKRADRGRFWRTIWQGMWVPMSRDELPWWTNVGLAIFALAYFAWIFWMRAGVTGMKIVAAILLGVAFIAFLLIPKKR